VYLQQIVNRAVENPLYIYLPLPTQSESIQPQCGADIAKYRFCRSESPVVDESAFYQIDFAFHLLCERLRLRLRTTLKEVHLSCLSTVWMSQASLP
jgi:hypothetical protein